MSQPPAPRAAQSAAPDPPEDLRDAILQLEDWAVKNQREAEQDARDFWRMKIPAIVISSGAGVVAYFDSTLVSQVAGMIAAVLVAIDGIRPKGQLRAVRYRAFSDIRNLEHTMMAQWRSRPETESDLTAVRRIIREAEPERTRIHTYLRDVEAPMTGA